MDGGAVRQATIAIIGGGFTGAALAYACAAHDPAARLLLLEPAAVLGKGLAYGTAEPSHRLNVPAQRVSLDPDRPDDFFDWGVATGAWADDTAAVLPDGRVFPRRAAFGAYVAARLAPLLEAGALTHVRGMAAGLSRAEDRWRVDLPGAAPVIADIIVLATGHAPSAAPGTLETVCGDRRVVVDAARPGALDGIGRRDRVLIVGTGLSMADAVAALDARGHDGPILAISRRGQLPRSHAATPCTAARFAVPADLRGSRLLAAIRRQIRTDGQAGLSWHGVIDALRVQGREIWQSLPPGDRRGLLRHARPYWETHRHRLPPPVDAILARRRAQGELKVRAASIIGAWTSPGGLQVGLRGSGDPAGRTETFDAIIVTTGPASAAAAPGLVRTLLQSGELRRDDTGMGFSCDDQSRAIRKDGECHPGLFLAGPLARGHFGELIGIPEIACQARAIARHLGALVII